MLGMFSFRLYRITRWSASIRRVQRTRETFNKELRDVINTPPRLVDFEKALYYTVQLSQVIASPEKLR